MESAPAMHEGFNIKPERWANFLDIFAVEFLQNSALPCIIESTDVFS